MKDLESYLFGKAAMIYLLNEWLRSTMRDLPTDSVGYRVSDTFLRECVRTENTIHQELQALKHIGENSL